MLGELRDEYEFQGSLKSTSKVGFREDANYRKPLLETWTSCQKPPTIPHEAFLEYPEIAHKLRWRHMIRHLTIRNKHRRRLISLNVRLRVKEWVNSDSRFEFPVKN